MVNEIDRNELKQKLDHPQKSILVEALSPDDFRKVHLPGAINIPADQVRSRAIELMPNKGIEVIVYCAGPTCHASHQAADELNALGYAKVRHYVGGKEDWIRAGLPVVRDEKPPAAA
jgi:rhodanese-related sulfurtransferase